MKLNKCHIKELEYETTTAIYLTSQKNRSAYLEHSELQFSDFTAIYKDLCVTITSIGL